MPTNALENPLVLPILGLLTERPLHGYAVFTGLRDRYTGITVRRSSVYTLLDRLVDADWLEIQQDTTPPRHTVTQAGRTALADGVVRGIRDAPLGPSTTFTITVAYLGILPRETAASLLEERCCRTLAALNDLQQALAAYPGPELHMLEAHYRTATLSHDTEWLRTTTQRIRRNDLTWPGA